MSPSWEGPIETWATQSNDLFAQNASVFITLGFGVDIGITKHDCLEIRSPGMLSGVPLGPATKQRIEELQEHLERLKVHAV